VIKSLIPLRIRYIHDLKTRRSWNP